VPYFFWVPYVVIALRPGPELDLPDGLRWIGVALSLLGIAFSLWAMVTLGRHYDLVLEVHQDHELVRRGPYALVRHPVYTGLGLHFAGACLATGNLLLIAGTLLVSYPAFYARARAEERLLRGRFGAEYEKYAQEVPMLVPLP
jgi:protein-S-isoprenylcysteine O-methyltransferase Ste14